LQIKKSHIKNLLLACRLNQWTKNLLIFLAPLFSFSFDSHTLIVSVKAFISFSLVSSSIYLLNDSIDKNKDKKHPIKKYRVIASDLISIESAIKISLILLTLSLLIGFSLNNLFVFLIILYFFIQIIYCFKLKNIPLIEFFCVASGFVLRSIAGALAAGILISSWFLLSIGLLSLFLAVEKRKAEILTLNKSDLITRDVLKSYSVSLINKFESVLTSSIVVTYSLWAYGPSMGGSSSQYMMITIPLVILGIFRYQMLSDINQNSPKSLLKSNLLETPEKVILVDRPMQIIIFMWLCISISIGLLT